jgi:hypothetical protein
MSLVVRNGRKYFYRSVRRGGRVTSEYLARGELAEIFALIELDRRGQREEQQALRRAWRDLYEADDRREAEHSARLAGIARAALWVAGFHRHDRGGWRKRRMSTSNDNQAAATPAVPARPSADTVKALVQRGCNGDEGAARELRRLFAGNPAEFIRLARGNLGQEYAVRAVNRVIPSQLALMREGVHAELARVRAELAGPSPTPVEALLAERAAHCWLDVYLWEMKATGKEVSFQTLATIDRFRDRAHRRYLQALKALAQVRTLRMPAVQVNVGRNQVIAAGGAPLGLPQ